MFLAKGKVSFSSISLENLFKSTDIFSFYFRKSEVPCLCTGRCTCKGGVVRLGRASLHSGLLNFASILSVNSNFAQNFFFQIHSRSSAYTWRREHILARHGGLYHRAGEEGQTYFSNEYSTSESLHQLLVSVISLPNLWVQQGTFLYLVGIFEEEIGYIYYEGRENEPCHVLFVVIELQATQWHLCTGFPILFQTFFQKLKIDFPKFS